MAVVGLDDLLGHGVAINSLVKALELLENLAPGLECEHVEVDDVVVVLGECVPLVLAESLFLELDDHDVDYALRDCDASLGVVECSLVHVLEGVGVANVDVGLHDGDLVLPVVAARVQLLQVPHSQRVLQGVDQVLYALIHLPLDVEGMRDIVIGLK